MDSTECIARALARNYWQGVASETQEHPEEGASWAERRTDKTWASWREAAEIIEEGFEQEKQQARQEALEEAARKMDDLHELAQGQKKGAAKQAQEYPSSPLARSGIARAEGKIGAFEQGAKEIRALKDTEES